MGILEICETFFLYFDWQCFSIWGSFENESYISFLKWTAGPLKPLICRILWHYNRSTNEKDLLDKNRDSVPLCTNALVESYTLPNLMWRNIFSSKSRFSPKIVNIHWLHPASQQTFNFNNSFSIREQ